MRSHSSGNFSTAETFPTPMDKTPADLGGMTKSLTEP